MCVPLLSTHRGHFPPPPHTSWDWAESPGRFHVLPPCLLFVLCLLLLSYFSIISSGLPISLLIEKRFPKFTLQNSFLLISAWVFQFYIHFNWQIFRLHFKKKKKKHCQPIHPSHVSCCLRFFLYFSPPFCLPIEMNVADQQIQKIFLDFNLVLLWGKNKLSSFQSKLYIMIEMLVDYKFINSLAT